MSTESNIDMYYEELICILAERANDDIKNGSDEDEAIYQALDDGLIYYADQAYIIAHALQNGLITWGEEVHWDVIFEDLYDDINTELENLKKEEA